MLLVLKSKLMFILSTPDRSSKFPIRASVAEGTLGGWRRGNGEWEGEGCKETRTLNKRIVNW